jgi:hypothetical protein
MVEKVDCSFTFAFDNNDNNKVLIRICILMGSVLQLATNAPTTKKEGQTRFIDWFGGWN